MRALRHRRGSLSLAAPLVMGVLNVTPDSFSDGGAHFSREAAVKHALALVEEGADIIDVGGESTRPGSAPVPPRVQKERVLPVIRDVRAAVDVALSVDTRSADVAAAAIEAGADIVNDVSAGLDDAEMFRLVAASGAAVVLMHKRGTPATMQSAPRYEDVVAEVAAHLARRAAAAVAAGVPRDRVAIDPGIGFGKGVDHNLLLLRDLARLAGLGYAVLVGPSRKRFLGALTGREVDERLFGTAAAVAAAVLAGAHIVRVHDVAAMMDVVRVAAAIRRGGNEADG